MSPGRRFAGAPWGKGVSTTSPNRPRKGPASFATLTRARISGGEGKQRGRGYAARETSGVNVRAITAHDASRLVLLARAAIAFDGFERDFVASALARVVLHAFGQARL